MKNNQNKFNAAIFLLGIFISALGSTTFMIGLMTFPFRMGISAAIIGASIGTGRIASVIINFFGGPIGDKVNPRKLIFIAELGALICSIAILFSSRSLSNENYAIFILFVGLRSIFTGIQTGSVQKVGKMFDDSFGSSGQFAKYLNKATFGSIFFAMLLTLIFLKFGSFSSLILFDASTFLINGLLLFFSIKNTKSNNSQILAKANLLNIWTENKNYFTQHRELSRLDIALAFAMMGANTLNVVLLSKYPDLVPYASGIFGLAVWLSTPLQKYLKIKNETLWIILGLSIGAQGFLSDLPYALLVCSFFRNISYWILYNHISAELMKNSKQISFASISSGRQTAINIIGAGGEFWVGLKLFPVFIETSWRSLILFSSSIYNRRKMIFTLTLCMMMISLKSTAAPTSEINIPIRTVNFNTDPQSMEDVTSLMINRQLYRGLMKYTSELELSKDLAENYEITDAGKIYRFSLGDSKFSDGSPITSKDVISTFKRMQKLKSAILADLHSIVGFSNEKTDLKNEFGIKALSDKVVEFKLSFADPFFIKNLAAVDCSILKVNEKLEKIPITSGRYSLIQSGANSSLILINKEDTKAPQKIHFINVASDEEAISLARKGLIDTLESYQVSDAERKELETIGWKSFKGQIAKLLLLSLNPKTIELKVRKSIFSILNQRSSDELNSEYYSATFGLIPNVLPGHLNQEETSSLISKNSNIHNKIITIAYPEVLELQTIATWVQKLLEKEKFKVKLTHFPISNYFEIIKQKKYEILLRSKYLDYPDGMALLTYFKSDLPINTFDAGSKTIDQEILIAQKEVDNAKRILSYKKIQLDLLKDYTLVPLATGSTQSALWFNKKVKSVLAHPMGFHSLYFHEIILASE